MLRNTAILLLILGFMATNVYAQQEATQESDVDISLSDDGLVSLDFRDADIRNVLKILSYKSGVNIVTSPEVTGLVSIQLNEVPWQEALDVILQTYGYAYERRGNILVVTTIENLKKQREDAMLLADQEPLETTTFVMNFAKASEVVGTLDRMKSERGSVDFDERTNTIIITDIQSKTKLMETVIARLDTTTNQVLIEAKIVETGFSDTENLGINWITQASISGSSRPVTFPFHGQTSQHTNYLPDTSTIIPDFTFGTLNFSQLSAVFEALKTKSDTNILSNPRIVTLDNKPASIIVGEQYPFPQYTYNEEQAALQVTGWDYKDIGVIFEVTPHVNSAGYITLEVHPEVSSIGASVVVSDTSVPRINTQETTTTVMIKDGNTLVIGGLVSSTTVDTKKRTPFLGDIPILGYAFRKSDVTTSKTDLLIFITPHIITPEVNLEK